MRQLFLSKTILAGITGVLLGAASETLINRIAGRIVIVDGVMWGAVLAILVVSLPNFTRMGYLTVKSDKTAVNFAVGVAIFALISVVSVGVLFAAFWLITRFVR
jgi:uncharacterized membrane protein YjfL (UPF0719 family)